VVLSTVRHAVGEDYGSYVIADATADPEVHRVLPENGLPVRAENLVHVIRPGDIR
jgi:hypothetical protein